ncbi:hypothetical protein AbraIFM66950_005080 [Aspergillus brasiliensis]|nr:hypothetical protein AbraIFM66950_005080 [Aspergillus brasiliensis]
MPSPPRRLNIGIIGAGEVFQICHFPILQHHLSHLYQIQSICDISPSLLVHTATKYSSSSSTIIPHFTTTPQEVIDHPSIETIFILTSDESHAPLTIAALKAGKNVFIEKPLTLSLPSVESILDAERHAPNGARVFVGYMRRYAPSYVQAFKREIADIPRILYARVRDFSGPNGWFVEKSGSIDKKYQEVTKPDYPAGAAEERSMRLDKLSEEAFFPHHDHEDNKGDSITDEMRKYCRFLGSLGSHDISIMRETLGFPEEVVGVSVNDPFYTATFAFRNGGSGGSGKRYAVTYESGIDGVAVFDAHVAVYGERKRVTIKYDSPYVKGLPIYVEVDEMNDNGEVQHRTVLSSYEDAYTAEMKEVYEAFANGKEIKTSVDDAKRDLEIFDMMYKKMGPT